MTERHLVAMGGGQEPDDPVFAYVAGLLSASRPKVCLLPTATSAVPISILGFLRAFPTAKFEPTFLDLFDRDERDLRGFLLSQDAIFVGGGNTANLLAIWRVHGLDVILREAWDAGVVLAGASAGANCWFQASTTDSFGPLASFEGGLGCSGGAFARITMPKPGGVRCSIRLSPTDSRPAPPATTSRPCTSSERRSRRSSPRTAPRAPTA
jgi:dipeptidase E